MAADLRIPGVLRVVSCSGLFCSWKLVLRDLPAAVLSCCVYAFWFVLSGCFECCVLLRPVEFLETSVEIPPACCSTALLCLWLLICAAMVFWVLCPVPACYVPGSLCWETPCLLQYRPVVSMASDVCRHVVLSVVSCSGLFCSWKPVLRDLLSAEVLSCCVYGFWCVPSWCFECYVLFRPVMFLETSVERPPVCCSPVLLCLWLLICAAMVFWVLCPVQTCHVPGNQCWDTSCLLQSRPVVSMASDLCRHVVLSIMSCSGLLFSWKPVFSFVLFRPVVFLETSVEILACFSPVLSCIWLPICAFLLLCMLCPVPLVVVFLETSVEIPPACCSPVLLCLWLLMCAVGVFWVLCPVQACFVPGNQCWDTSCLLQSRSVVSYNDFWSVPSWCFEYYVLFRPVMFLETCVERPTACFSPVLLCIWLLICAVGGFECCVLFRTVVFLETSIERLACFSPVLSCIWLLICSFLVFCMLCPVLACLVPGNQCWETCILQSCPVIYMAADLLIFGVLRVVSCFSLSCSWKPVLRDLHTSVLSCHLYGCWSAHFWCSACCVLFWPVLFLETSVERLACFSPVLSFIWLPICSFLVFCVLCPVLACLVPGNQCWETCLLQFRPVVSMASDVCCHDVLSVASCFGLSCSWKPVLRDLLSASVQSCFGYVFWFVLSGCFECFVLLRPVEFLETSVERHPACFCRVLFLACCVPGNQCWDTFCLLQSRPVVSKASDLWVLVFWVLCPVLACCVPGNQCRETCLLQSRPVVCKACGSWCFECCVMFLPVVFLEISVERPVCCSPVLLYVRLVGPGVLSVVSCSRL